MASDRAHDVVLLGATGFTGGLTAEYLVANSPPDSRLALAGRNRTKLEALRSRLAQADPARAELPLLHADSSDEGSLRELAESARVVVTHRGPVHQVRRAAGGRLRRGGHRLRRPDR